MANRYKREEEAAEAARQLLVQEAMAAPQQAPATPLRQTVPTYPVQQSHNRMASMVSAPVSRSADAYAYSPQPRRPDQVHLSRDQAELCRKLNLTPDEYAVQLLRMEERKKSGDL